MCPSVDRERATGPTDGPRRRPRRSRGPDAAEPRRSRRVWLRERDRRRRRQNLAPSLTSSDAPPWWVGGGRGMVGEGVLPCRSGSCLGTAVLRDLSDSLRKQCAYGARLSAHEIWCTASGVRLQVHGFAQFPASFQRLPAYGSRLTASGARISGQLFGFAFRANCSDSLDFLRTPGRRWVGHSCFGLIHYNVRMCVTCKFHPAFSQGWMKATALLI